MQKKVTLPNDYERMIPEYHKGSPVYAEHIVRYEGAQELVKDKIVLDIASGSGYGTKLLAKKAKKMYGVDVSEPSVEYARENYGAPNIEYLVGDGEKIPLPDNSIEVVVSFETIEHIKDYQQFMREVKRVLKKDGLLLLSTPNVVEFAEGNHFHLHEFEEKELMSLITDHYVHTKSYYQGTWLYNALLDEKGLTEEWEMPLSTLQTAPINLKQCLYFYVLCSDRQITETVTPTAAISGHWSERGHQKYDKTLRDQLGNQQHDLEYLSNEVRVLRDRVAVAEEHLSQAQDKVNATNRDLVSYKSHILTLPYRTAQKVKKAVTRRSSGHHEPK